MNSVREFLEGLETEVVIWKLMLISLGARVPRRA